MSKVGVFKVDITPPLGIEFIGYHRPTGVKNVDERIYAIAFVFESNKTKTVFISIDNIGMLIDDTSIIREQIAIELNITLEEITVVFTHTHSGPATVSNSEVVKAYKTILIKNVVKAAVKANENVQLSEVGWNVTMGEIGVNRREETPNGKVDMGTNENGIVDQRIGILAIRNQGTQKLSGAVVFCTAHPNVLKSDSDILSADYPGLTRRILEQALHCPVIIVQGASGNVNAKYRGSLKAIEKMAYALSGYVLTMMPTIAFSPIFKLKTISTKYKMNLRDIPEPDRIKRMALSAEKQWGVNTNKWLIAMLNKYKQQIKNYPLIWKFNYFKSMKALFQESLWNPLQNQLLMSKKNLTINLLFLVDIPMVISVIYLQRKHTHMEVMKSNSIR
jgi:hypothetical protein